MRGFNRLAENLQASQGLWCMESVSKCYVQVFVQCQPRRIVPPPQHTVRNAIHLWGTNWVYLYNLHKLSVRCRATAQAVSLSPGCHRGDLGLIPDLFTWHLSCITWHWDRNLLLVLWFPLLVSFHQCCILFFALTLILSEGQAGEAWDTLKHNSSLSSIEDH